MTMIEKQTIDPATFERLGIARWPTWSAGVSRFPWTYDCRETCYLLEGRVSVIPEGGTPVEIRAGELVSFPAGLSCVWEVHEPVRKHYRFD